MDMILANTVNIMAPKSSSKARSSGSNRNTKPAPKDGHNPPEPFKRPSEHHEQFLSKLSQNHVYITHIDDKPRDFKKKIFAVPTLMNIAIIAAVVYRATTIAPFYLNLLLSASGQPNETTIDKAVLTNKQLGYAIIRRTGTFLIDLIIYMFVISWPWNFFVGQDIGSPVAWRWNVGFKDKEIVVRRSKKWTEGLQDLLVEGGSGQQVLFPIVWRAVDSAYMNEKTGYLMLNNEWDLDWNLMQLATQLVDKKALTLDDFRTTIYVYTAQFGWVIVETMAASGSAKEEEGRKKIVAFKDELTAMGKENLFFKWIELVQFESTGPEGFGPEQQAKTMDKAKAMFESQGVDFDAFWKKIGGMDGLPGMD